MIFLPILRATLGSDSAASPRESPPRTSGILHFPLEFLPFFLPHTEAQFELIFCEFELCSNPQDHQNPGPSESFIFLWNSLHFPTLYCGSS